MQFSFDALVFHCQVSIQRTGTAQDETQPCTSGRLLLFGVVSGAVVSAVRSRAVVFAAEATEQPLGLKKGPENRVKQHGTCVKQFSAGKGSFQKGGH